MRWFLKDVLNSALTSAEHMKVIGNIKILSDLIPTFFRGVPICQEVEY